MPPPNDLLTGLQRYYSLDGDGTEAVSAQHGVPTGPITWPAGARGPGASFNADNSCRIVAPGLNLLTDLSISMWVYLIGNKSYAGMVTQQLGAGAANTNYSVLCNGSSVILLGANNSGTGSLALTTGYWTHVVITRTTAGVLKFWRNGSLVATGSGPPPNSVPTADLWIGNRPDLYNAFPGIMDEVCIYDTIISQNQIVALLGDGTPPAYADFGDPLPELHTMMPVPLNSMQRGILVTPDSYFGVAARTAGGDEAPPAPSGRSSNFNSGFN